MTSSEYFEFGLGVVSKGDVVDRSFALLDDDIVSDIPDLLFRFDNASL